MIVWTILLRTLIQTGGMEKSKKQKTKWSSRKRKKEGTIWQRFKIGENSFAMLSIIEFHVITSTRQIG